MANNMKTVLLLGLLTAVLIFAGQALGGTQGMWIAFVMAVAMNFFSYWYSDKIVLKLYKAHPISEDSAPELFHIVRELAQQAEIPMPRIYAVENDTPNAFATGRNPEHAVVAVTSGLLKLCTAREVRGVLAHEMGHVKDRDILISSVAATLAGAVMIIANMARWFAFLGGGRDSNNQGGGLIGLIVFSIVGPLAAMLIQMAISRSREYLADREGAEISGDPNALADALQKLESYNRKLPMTQAPPQAAHLCIVNPLSGGGLAGLFSTHPPIGERIARLREMGGQGRGASVGSASGGKLVLDKPVDLRQSPGGGGQEGPVSPRPQKQGGGRGSIDWS